MCSVCRVRYGRDKKEKENRIAIRPGRLYVIIVAAGKYIIFIRGDHSFKGTLILSKSCTVFGNNSFLL